MWGTTPPACGRPTWQAISTESFQEKGKKASLASTEPCRQTGGRRCRCSAGGGAHAGRQASGAAGWLGWRKAPKHAACAATTAKHARSWTRGRSALHPVCALLLQPLLPPPAPLLGRR